MAEEEKKSQGNESLQTLKSGLVQFSKLIGVIIISFFKAITMDFSHNIREQWGKLNKPKEKTGEGK